jgi:conjugal transfer mating pair stabilization protein TraG
MADGSQVLNVGSSNLPISMNSTDSSAMQASQMASQNVQKAMSQSESSAHNLSSTARNSVNLSDSLAKLESAGDSASLGISTEQSKAIHHGANLTREFSKQNGIEEGKSAQMLASASFGTGKGAGLLGGSVGMGGDISAKEQELNIKAQKFAEDHNYQQALRESANASKQISHSLTDESARRLAEEVSGSYEMGMSQRSEASKSFRLAEDYSNQASYIRANSASINANHNQQFGEWLAAQPADNTNGGTIGARGASHIIAAKPQETMMYAQRFMAEKGLTPTNTVSSGATARSSYDQDQSHQVHAVTRDSLQNVRNQANDMTSVGSAARDAVEVAQSQHGQSISNESRSALDQGADLKRNVQAEQNKGVVRRLSGKGTKEISNMIDDVKNIKFGESQQK